MRTITNGLSRPLTRNLAAAIAVGFSCVALSACGGGSNGGGSSTVRQLVTWTWTGGATSTTQSAVSGPPGVNTIPFVTAPAQGTTGLLTVNPGPALGGPPFPGARAGAASWTDSQGNSWLFGGNGFDSKGVSGQLNDLWKYEASSGQWTLVSGSNAIGNPGLYGTKGVAGAGNVPGSREAAVTFVDSQGNLWLFGGEGFDSAGSLGLLNDLWEYTPAAGKWTWVAGSNIINVPGAYGVRGTGAPGNAPGSRAAAVGWVDSKTGDRWLFGGVGLDSHGTIDGLNDLWKYSGGQWTWMGGSNTVDAAGVYGSMGRAGAANVPGARAAAAGVATQGLLWLATGAGVDSTGTFGGLNNNWNYNLATGQWTWVSGSNTVDATGVYGTKGVAAAGNTPGARAGANIWTDNSGALFLFAGVGLDSAGAGGVLNDVWKYQPGSGEWAWVGGSNAANEQGHYGTLGTGATDNTPGARLGAVSISDTRGNHLILGGLGIDATGSFGYLNDFWSN